MLNHQNALNGELAAFTHCVMQGVLMMWFQNLCWIDLVFFVEEWVDHISVEFVQI